MSTLDERTVHGLFSSAPPLLMLAALMWGANAVAGKIAAELMSPVTLTFMRWLMACCIIAPLAGPHLARDLAGIRASWRRLLLMGGVGFAGFNLCLYTALNYTTAINASIEQSCMPMVIMLGCFLFLKQRISVLQGIGVALSILGVLVTATRGAPGSILELALNRGDAIMMFAVVIYSGYTIALRNKPQLHWLSLLMCMSVGALLVSGALFAAEVISRGFVMPSPAGWLLIGFTAVFPSLLAQLFFMRGVELVGANRAGVFINLVPIFGAFLAVVVLGEALEGYHVVGLVLVFAGIATAERFARR
jgi:drug/metabolite transporter (DMT)-like permease